MSNNPDLSEDPAYIDKDIRDHALQRRTLDDLAQRIAGSARDTVVTFIDLADSTSMKDAPPHEWLGIIYEFIRRCTLLVEDSHGIVVKRIGDEVMATFRDVRSAEAFLASLCSNPAMENQRFKVAITFGKAYHFQFVEGQTNDPYGLVVDRCARLASLVKPGFVLCDEAYLEQLTQKDAYLHLGSFPLKGFPKGCNIYIRSIAEQQSSTYLEPLIEHLNARATRFDAFRSIGRKFTGTDIRNFDETGARPFLARELLNLPKLPYSGEEFNRRRTLCQDDKMFEASVIGYIVEWNLDFWFLQQEDSGYLAISTKLRGGGRVSLRITRNYLEIGKSLIEGQTIKVRGVIEKIIIGTVYLNFVEIEVLSNNSPEDGRVGDIISS